jgi:enoyl-CoA hydratase
VSVEVTDRVATLTFDNQSKRNALNMGMIEALGAGLRRLQDDDDVRVVVVTGAGGKAFVSGVDISEFETRRTSVEARAAFDAAGREMGRAWHALEKPVVAMIRGFCIGGGLRTALQADLRVAAPHSTFGIPAARLGLGYDQAGVDQLVAVVGPARASELLLTARFIDAARAEAIGLVNQVVDDGAIEAEVAELAAVIAGNAPLTVKASKLAIREAVRSEEARDTAGVAAAVEACFRSEDYREGQRAFMEKRPPEFRGR